MTTPIEPITRHFDITIKNPKFIEQLPKIEMIKLKLEKLGRATRTQRAIGKELVLLAKKANLDNPNEVNLAIARYKLIDPHTREETNQPASNTYKSLLVNAYSKYIDYYKIQDWEKPHYTPQPKGIQPPTEERIKLLIASAKIPLSLKISVSKETGLRPKEVTGETGLKVKDIHRDTKTITARSLKGCNQRPAIPITDELLTGLTMYITSKNLKHDDLIFEGNSDTYTNHFIRFKNTIAKRLNDPTIKQIRLYDIRHWYITKQLKRTQNAETVRILVGHTRLNTTQKYLHLLGNLTTSEWIIEGTTDTKRAKELLAQDFTYQLTAPDGTMLFRKPK